MLYWALIFLVIALIAGLFGFRQIAGVSMQISKILFFLFLIIFVIFLIMGLSVRTAWTNFGILVLFQKVLKWKKAFYA